MKTDDKLESLRKKWRKERDVDEKKILSERIDEYEFEMKLIKEQKIMLRNAIENEKKSVIIEIFDVISSNIIMSRENSIKPEERFQLLDDDALFHEEDVTDCEESEIRDDGDDEDDLEIPTQETFSSGNGSSSYPKAATDIFLSESCNDEKYVTTV